VYKRGITLGFVIGWGNLNGIVASNIYRAADKPLYRLGHGVVLAYLTLFLLGGSVITHLMLRAENRKRRAGKRDASIEGKSEEEIDLMGDKRWAVATCHLGRMLAVMTMNTGYFLSVVVGTFAGSVLLGGHTVAAGH
jgi:hypothetical protein